MDKITANAITDICFKQPRNNQSNPFAPVLQILNIKLFTKNNSNASSNSEKKYRVVLSDGSNFMQAMMSTQISSLVTKGDLQRFDLVKLTKFTCNEIQSRKILIILDLKIVCKMSEKLGVPTSIESIPNRETENCNDSEYSTHNNAQANRLPSNTSTEYTGGNNKQSYNNGFNNEQSITMNPTPINDSYKTPSFNTDIQNNFKETMETPQEEDISTILSINPFQNKWKIKARISQKSDLRSFKNAKGDGKLFNVVLVDQSGEIKATGFNESADQFYNQLETGKVYYLSGCRVATAKKQFNNVNNEYELFFQSQTLVEECHTDTSSLPTIKFNFTKLSELDKAEVNDMVDVICVVDTVYPINELKTKATQQLITKRDIMVVDTDNLLVRLTLWTDQAAEITEENKGDVICIKGVKVGEYNGKNLSAMKSSIIQINPDTQEAYSLKSWYSSNSEKKFESLNKDESNSKFKSLEYDQIQAISQVKEENHDSLDTQNNSIFLIKPTIIYIKAEQISYPSCQSDNCKKKVHLNGSLWYCEKCDQTFTKENYRYMVSMLVADHSGEMWITFFDQTAVRVFGITANEAERLKRENATDEYNELITRSTFQQFLLKCRAKEDIYNDIATIRYTADAVLPVDFVEDGRQAIIEIEQLLSH